MIRQYCIQIGYTMPDEDTLKITPYTSEFGVISEGVGGKNIYNFNCTVPYRVELSAIYTQQ